jgi:hypothetical protein
LRAGVGGSAQYVRPAKCGDDRDQGRSGHDRVAAQHAREIAAARQIRERGAHGLLNSGSYADNSYVTASSLPRPVFFVLTVILLALPVFLVHGIATRSLVRHVGRYDPLATIPPERRILHLYFTEEPTGFRGAGWRHTVEAAVGTGVPVTTGDAGETQFTGYDRDGRVLFVRHTSLVWARQPPGVTYLADVFPAPPDIERRLGRIEVTHRGRTYTKSALPDAPPSARAIAIDASHVRIELDCAHHSSVMVHYSADRDLTAASDDALETFRNCWSRSGAASLQTPVETRNRTIYLDFNNGLLFSDRAVPIAVAGR